MIPAHDRPDFVIHTASQPSNDKAASIPYEDYNPANQIGDHICYISDLTKIRAHFPNWRHEYQLGKIVEEIVQHYACRQARGGN